MILFIFLVVWIVFFIDPDFYLEDFLNQIIERTDRVMARRLKTRIIQSYIPIWSVKVSIVFIIRNIILNSQKFSSVCYNPEILNQVSFLIC